MITSSIGRFPSFELTYQPTGSACGRTTIASGASPARIPLSMCFTAQAPCRALPNPPCSQ